LRVPGSSANLGPGFDCAGVALELWNELRVLPAAEGEPLVELEGEGADELPTDETHLALRAFAHERPGLSAATFKNNDRFTGMAPRG